MKTYEHRIEHRLGEPITEREDTCPECKAVGKWKTNTAAGSSWCQECGCLMAFKAGIREGNIATAIYNVMVPSRMVLSS